MARIIWRRRGVEWVGRLTKDGPDRFAVRKVRRNAPPFPMWSLSDLQTGRTGQYVRLMDAKAAAEAQR